MLSLRDGRAGRSAGAAGALGADSASLAPRSVLAIARTQRQILKRWWRNIDLSCWGGSGKTNGWRCEFLLSVRACNIPNGGLEYSERKAAGKSVCLHLHSAPADDESPPRSL